MRMCMCLIFYRKRKLIRKSTVVGTLGSFGRGRKREGGRVRHCRSHLACRSPISKMLLNKLVETNSNWKLISIRFDATIFQFRTQRQVYRPTER